MAQPQWITRTSSLSTIPEGIFYQIPLQAEDPDGGPVYYQLIAGQLPDGIQVRRSGLVEGIPTPTVIVQGVPAQVSSDVTSKFAIRAYTEKVVSGRVVTDRINDRTFTLTVSGQNIPQFVTPSGPIGTYYDGSEVNIQLEFTDPDVSDRAVFRVLSGSLPPGVVITNKGLITGLIIPLPQSQLISKNYEFTIEVSDGKDSDVRAFSIYVYAKSLMTADNTDITSDNTFITADIVTAHTPILLTPPGDLGRVRADNFYAFKFDAIDFDRDPVEYVINIGTGIGYDSTEVVGKVKFMVCSGSLGGFVLDIELVDGSSIPEAASEIFVGMGVSGIGISFGSIVVDITGTTVTIDRPLLDAVFASVTFFGKEPTNTTDNGDPGSFDLDNVGFDQGTFALPPGLSIDSATGWFYGYIPDQGITETTYRFAVRVRKISEPDLISPLAYFTITIIGNVETEVTWLTEPDLGSIVNGAISTLEVAAINAGGRALQYQIAPGTSSSLPQGLTLLSSGHIVGRVSFNTFALDSGTTTFDDQLTTRLVIDETTFDMSHTFVVNAFSPVTNTPGYVVTAIIVSNSGTGYSSATPPTVTISAPPNTLNSQQATAGAIVINDATGKISSIAVGNPGRGYSSPPTITITGGGGSNATAVVQVEDTTTLNPVSVFREFTVTVVRQFNSPYESLYVKAMPTFQDRVLIDQLLYNQTVIPTEYVYRADDSNFGVSRNVVYTHAYGLVPSTLDKYAESLNINHYWKNVVLGDIKLAQALDSQGNVLYEVVYSEIVDNLVNAQGASVSKQVTLPYPADNQTVVYPNSLINMRDQVIDQIGQVSPALPAWMISKQANGRVLGFVPAWVIAYIKPGYGGQVLYNIRESYGDQLHRVDFKIDRYELDRSQTHNWDPVTSAWIPSPGESTIFDSDTTYFDGRDTKFIAPADRYTNTDAFDKYLLFPKTNILGR